jgi:tRNA threonylcarbamoyl adenosine modification protein YjeE
MGTDRIFLPDDDATAALGAHLAAQLKPGDLVLLEGGLGAGKTALARSIILVQPYDANDLLLLHADLYRIASPREIDELGLFDDARAIVLVEWPDRDPELSAQAALKVTLTVPPDGRGRLAEVTS